MKSMTKLMVVAMILAAALVVAPAAARTVDSLNTTIYVGEEGINFVGNFSDIQSLRHYSGDTEDNVITVTDASSFDLTASDVDGIYGSYRVYNATAANGSVIIRAPSVTVDVMLNQSGKNPSQLKDSVGGKSITRQNEVIFKLTNNLGGFAGYVGPKNNISIDVTLPGGGVVRQLKTVSLENIPANGTNWYSANVSMAGLEAGTYTVQANWPSASDFYGKGFNSNTVTFELLTKSLAVTSSKDSLVRGNSFSVTVTGESKETYRLFIKPDTALGPDEYPFIVAGQAGVDYTSANPTRNVTVETTAGGVRSVQFNTNTTTDDRTYTIRVESLTDPTGTYDEVKVKVEKGSVTITASGTGTYYIGEEVTLSGTCTDNATTVHLFMTGPNLASANGVNILTLQPVTNNATGTFKTADVESDDTWSLKWNTGDIATQGGALDSGGYTIYAVSKPLDKSKLSDAQYATASIQLRSGFITATSSGAVVARGDDLTLTGTAQGDPDFVKVWIFGKNKQILGDSATVEDDGSFEYELKGGDTSNLAAGQYFVVIQHPMMNKEFDINTNATAGWIVGRGVSGFAPVYIRGLQASDAATALINALDSPNIDDTYVKLTFLVEEPNIWIDAIGDKAAGSTFTITGTTNLAVGDTLNVEVTSAAFQPTSKSEASGFGSVAGTTEVKQGDGANTWSFEVDGASFKPDQYIVKIESIETSTTSTATFNVVEAVPTTQATPTATATGEVTPTATTTTEATPTQSPGFGALLALAGLGAVAFLVLRRD
ncbi:MEMAR_RS02690 family S-layer glycoprotein [Methanoculleus horonobensis]|uniref:MEMAR_RS02690 family S-layer glycoprotein n=1 Tax=Methanoculleus horonobensis TaxID=528314 RepID=UPI000835B120|nr:MEMAR_RS02690 family S-layer glycoprotein [Methanoculleus horonobensis]